MDSEAVVVRSFGTEGQQNRLSFEGCVEFQLEGEVYGGALHGYIRWHICQWQLSSISFDF